MTKFEIAKAQIEIVESMYNAVMQQKQWSVMEYDSSSGSYSPCKEADADLVNLYDCWLAKIEKMI